MTATAPGDTVDASPCTRHGPPPEVPVIGPVIDPALPSPVGSAKDKDAAGRRATRGGAFSGLAAVVLILSGFALLAARESTLRAPAEVVAAFYADASLVRLLAGGLLQGAGFVLLLPFAVALTDRLRGDGATGGLLPATARSAATVYVTLCLAPGLAAGGAALWLAHSGPVDAGVLHAINLLRIFGYFVALLPLAAFLIAVGVSAIGSHRLPRWAGWSAVAIGAPLVATVPVAASDATNLLGMLGLLWIVPVAVHLLRHPGPAARG